MEEAIYDGAGNLFRMIDGRGSGISPSAFEGELARRLCLLQGGSKADGIILLSGAEAPGCDFSMHYFNNDGTGGMMCGNGGRCAIAFARDRGFAPSSPDGMYRFTSAGGFYCGSILEDGPVDKVVRLKMADVYELRRIEENGKTYGNGWYLDVGCPHYVTFLDSEEEVEKLDIETAALPWRHSPLFPEGANVNFASLGPRSSGQILIRTFERGVEAETLSCGTGIVATSIAAALKAGLSGKLHFDVHARGGNLSVDFDMPSYRKDGEPAAKDIFLTGPTHRH
ncbi:MAG: diaminopimelate epimerase [Bacteroidales bacterium]|nr:diaminopimelate epimerase [Bacteroidales bacterium]